MTAIELSRRSVPADADPRQPELWTCRSDAAFCRSWLAHLLVGTSAAGQAWLTLPGKVIAAELVATDAG
jgi:hypothetical protein